MLPVWHKFDYKMQQWYIAHLPISEYIMGGVGLLLGCSLVIGISLLW